MSAGALRPAAVRPAVRTAPTGRQGHVAESDPRTRERVLELVATAGPVSAADLAATLGLTPAAVRRHLALLEDDDLVAVHDAGHPTGMRGRPARRYVATSAGQSELSGTYADLATDALRFLRDVAGADAVEKFAHERLDGLAARYADRLDAPDVEGRAAQLAAALADDGYAASVRPVPGGHALQLCQGHCPVQHVAEEFPQLCEAEAQVFATLLGSHVQRLATLATGGHACTTNVPLPVRPAGADDVRARGAPGET
ncbi:helix-turn-helix transcriptional regulator [Cellulosimicrobium marinum]|uniref:helix-turn-helix transcriptional regulator n=1 Tax=Cellulosimicrobium marinum TaxID=1638992 RepID=UPI001E45B57C|nr:crosslink repair DNA glycosylase YcaQ family protein [Cellulosimicrobium marinum]MCB7138151.1 helix-turn-helix domain-containing protein [Cellulosimicrobium marinum]